jgi:tRNA modification GTPase
MNDTIAAVATAPGRGAVGMVRLSGPGAFAIARQLTATALPPPRQAALRHLHDAHGGVLDTGLVLVFPAPRSFTGEDVVELQGHGGPVVLEALLAAACALGARRARPGEFSERAFLNGRLDLAQAEAIADLINAGSAAAARAAARSLDGLFSAQVNALAEGLIAARVFIEGALDFSDEDINWLADAQLVTRLDALEEQLGALLAAARRGQRLQQGLSVALTGSPNVGKSTLLNRLAGSDRAIVTDIPGTTRDVLRETLDLDGLPLTLLDTAGLRESGDVVEQEGIRRAWAALQQAELILFLVDDRSGPTPADQALLARLPAGSPVRVIRNKCDLSGAAPARLEADGRVELRLCAASGAGIELLVQEIKTLAGLGAAETETAFSARSRHVDALVRTQTHLRATREHLHHAQLPELAAEELRQAHEALGEITGRFSPDDLLGRIFSSFCIGK